MLTKLYIEAISWLYYWLIVLLNRSLRLTVVAGENYYRLKDQHKNIVFVFWHQATFIPLYHYRQQQACILTMAHLKGEILARAAERLGYLVVRLAREDDPAGVLQLLRLARQGRDINLAVDGPLGPIYQVKPGAMFLAKKLGYPILPVGVSCNFKVELPWRWDKYLLPLPFAKMKIIFGQPIDPKDKKVDELRQLCQAELDRLTI